MSDSTTFESTWAVASTRLIGASTGVETELQRINDRLDGIHRTMVHGFIALTAAMMAGHAATIGLVITQL
jgi:hypothetical protein